MRTQSDRTDAARNFLLVFAALMVLAGAARDAWGQIPCNGIPNFAVSGSNGGPGKPATLVSLKWDAVTDPSCDGPCSYEVIGRIWPGFCSVPEDPPFLDAFTSPSQTTYDVRLPRPDTAYTFFVQVASAPQINTCFSLEFDTYPPPAKPLLSADSTAPGTVTLTYSYPADTVFDLFLLRTTPGSASSEQVRVFFYTDYCPAGSVHTFVDYGPGGSASTGGRLAPGKYIYELVAQNFGTAVFPGDVETSSGPVEVTVGEPCTKAGDPSLRVNNATSAAVVVGDSYTLNWNDVFVDQPGSYDVEVLRGGIYNTVLRSTSATSFSATAQQGDLGATLFYRIRARPDCAGIDTSLDGYSNTVEVAVGCPPAITPTVTSPGGSTFSVEDTFHLTWDGNLTAGQYLVKITRSGGPEDDISVPAPNASYDYRIKAEDEGQTLTFTVQAQPSCGGPSPFSNAVQITVNPACTTAPSPPGNPRIASKYGGPVTATSFLDLGWDSPAGPVSGYHWMINGGQEGDVPGTVTQAEANPVGSAGEDTITLSVNATNSCGAGGVATHDESPSPPVAEFSWSVSGLTVTFTDTSSGAQATSWLWLFGDSLEPASTQSASHTYASAGAYTVWLVASNGAGSSQQSHYVSVGLSAASATPIGATTRAFDPAQGVRRRVDDVAVAGVGRTWLRVMSREPGEAIVFLRFFDPSGALAKERRLSIPAGREALFDVGAFGLTGTYTLEVVSMHDYTASLVETAPHRGISLPRRHGPTRTEDPRE